MGLSIGAETRESPGNLVHTNTRIMRLRSCGRPARGRANWGLRATMENLQVPQNLDRGSACDPPSRVMQTLDPPPAIPLENNVVPQPAVGDASSREKSGNVPRIDSEVQVPYANVDFDRVQVSTGGSGLVGIRNFVGETNRDEDLEIRKRKLDLEIEESRKKIKAYWSRT